MKRMRDADFVNCLGKWRRDGALRGFEFEKLPAGPGSERGVALVVALMLTMIVSLLMFTLVTRSFVASRMAGFERFSVMTFYAADAGINGAKARAVIGETGGFGFDLPDLRGVGVGSAGGPVGVDVGPFFPAGPPRAMVGSQIGGGQGSDGESLCVMVYRGESRALHLPTGSRRRISATLSVGPLPLSNVAFPGWDGAGGGQR